MTSTSFKTVMNMLLVSNLRPFDWVHPLVSEEDVSREAQEIEMERERYVGDLHLALTGEGPAAEGEYSFHLTPERPGSPLLQLSYEKVQNDISVSGTHEIATQHSIM